jgi:DNA repair ATPase RecN
VIDLAEFKAKKAEVDARRTSVEQELQRLDAQERLLEQVRVDTTSLVEYCQRVQANLAQFDNAEKRVAMEALNITVIWHREKPLEITGRIPVAVASDAPCCTPRRAPGRRRRC